ncbi:type II toxin-antitoxin system RelE family toxin [Achromobacter sp. AGC25]
MICPNSIDPPPCGSRHWRYRVGDFRIIASIEHQALCVLVVKVGNRRDVYRR